MEENLSLSLQQKLRQSLSPAQVQYVRLLEMTGAEVEDEVRNALADNPALEEVTEPATIEDASGSEDDFRETAEEMQLADYRSEDDIPYYRLEASNRSVDDEYYEPVAVAGGESLMDYLMAQLSQMRLDERSMKIARFVTGSIDDNGYMTRTVPALVEDTAILGDIDVSLEEMREIWNCVRSLEPAGVGAMDLRDCLLLQLKRMDSSSAVEHATEIVTHYFDIFSRMHYSKLQSAMNLSEEELRDAVDVIRTLNPKPGTLVSASGDESQDRLAHIVPDFLVENDNGTLTMTLVNNLPQLQIESSFAAGEEIEVAPRMSKRDKDAYAFISQKRDEASTFIKVLEMRQETLRRVMTAIIKLQRDFFLSNDPQRMHPMILRDIAEITGYDVSVISRATSGKYVATQHGIYPLKFFFNERTNNDSDTSSHEILAALQNVIKNEDKQHPFNDDAIAAMLKEQGYDLARRTVAKYREKLGIPVARLRKSL